MKKIILSTLLAITFMHNTILATAIYGVQPATNSSLNVLTYQDFIVHGDNSISNNMADKNVVSFFKLFDWKNTNYIAYITFKDGDNASTNRGISFNSKYADVIEKYGNAELKKYSYATDEELKIFVEHDPRKNPDVDILNDNYAYVTYGTEYEGRKVYIRFYFDENSKVKLLMYYLYNK